MQPQFEITINPLDLSEYGKTPKGKPVYRIVWSDTRLMKVRYMGKNYTLPMYDHLAGKWVMERHMPAERVVGMSRAAYEALVTAQGLPEMPYPEDGEYEFVMAFPQEVVPGAARKVIEQIEFQRNNLSDKERKAINKENAALEEIAKEKAQDHILEAAMDRTDAEVKLLNEERIESQEKAKEYIDWEQVLHTEGTHATS